jgi:hypothetical protein
MDVDPGVLKTILESLGLVGVPLGVMAYICVYYVRVAMPNLVREFREETAAIRAEALAERQQHAAHVERLSQAIETLAQTIHADGGRKAQKT